MEEIHVAHFAARGDFGNLFLFSTQNSCCLFFAFSGALWNSTIFCPKWGKKEQNEKEKHRKNKVKLGSNCEAKMYFNSTRYVSAFYCIFEVFSMLSFSIQFEISKLFFCSDLYRLLIHDPNSFAFLSSRLLFLFLTSLSSRVWLVSVLCLSDTIVICDGWKCGCRRTGEKTQKKREKKQERKAFYGEIETVSILIGR